MTQKTIKYTPSVTCAKFHASASPVKYLQGPVGSGKSSTCVVEIWRSVMEQQPGSDGVRRSRWAIIRNSYPILKSTTIKTWLDWVPESAWGPIKYDSPISHRMHTKLQDGTILDAEILFLSLDKESDSKKLLSLELTGAWINEAKETRRDVFDLLQSRVGRFPAQRDGGPTWSGVILDSNPPAVDHWLHRMFVTDKPKSWDFFQQPSGLSDKAENLENLQPGYYKRVSEVKDEQWIKAFVHGDFAFVSDGRPVHPGFQYRTHVYENPVEPQTGAETVIGLDFGLSPAAVFMQREKGTERFSVTDEIITEAGTMGAANFARALNKLIQQRYRDNTLSIYGDPAGTQRAQTDERTIFDILSANGVYAQPAPSNDVDLRLGTVDRLLETLLIDGRPAIMFSPSCEGIISALSGGYRFKRMQISGDERYHDRPDKNRHSHIADALQYGLMGTGEGYLTSSGGKKHVWPELVYPDLGLI